MKNNKLNKYWIIITLITIVAFSAYQYVKDSSLQETEARSVKQQKLTAITQSPDNTPLSSENHKQQKNINVAKTVVEQDIDGIIKPAEVPVPKEFAKMKPGITITSIDDQPIPDVFKTMSRTIQQQMKYQGYTEASEDEVMEIERYLSNKNKKDLKPLVDIENKLTFIPANLDKVALFTESKPLGSVPGGAFVEGKWTGLTRLYKTKNLGIVKFDEDDYVGASSGIQLTKELINIDINGNPAIYTVQVSGSDKALTKITWVTNNKEFSLSTDQNAAKINGLKDSLLDIAHSIPVD